MPRDAAVWGIRAGETGDADTLFVKENVVALSLGQIGRLQTAKSDRAEIKRALVALFPEKSPMTIARNAGQLFSFLHTVVSGDLMVYPSRIDRLVHIGRVNGPYYFDESGNSKYPHRRSVIWLATVPRNRFSQEALFEMGSATTLFQIRRHGDEFRAAAKKKA